MRHRGSCHCGRVRFEIESDLDAFFRCNCSLCARRGSVITYVPARDFTLLEGKEDLGGYQWGPRSGTSHFCRTCGIWPFSESTWAGDHRFAINAACLDGVDALAVETQLIDGRSFTLPDEVLEFWFRDGGAERWAERDPNLRDELRGRFHDAASAAVAGHMESWANTALGRVGLILMLDPMAVELFRDRPEAAEARRRARAHAAAALQQGEDRELEPGQRRFVYLPLLRSADTAVRERAETLLRALADDAANR